MEITSQELSNLKGKNLNPKFEKKLVDAMKTITGFKAGFPVTGRVGFENLKVVSFWALFFFAVPYLIRGMWKKAIVLALILFFGQLAFAFAISFGVLDSSLGGMLMQFFCIGMCAYASGNYYYDSFRKYARNENFWF